jgi:hypothetical protein
MFITTAIAPATPLVSAQIRASVPYDRHDDAPAGADETTCK